MKSIMESLNEKNVNIIEATKMVHYRSEWQGFVKVHGCESSPGGEPHHKEIPHLKSVTL